MGLADKLITRIEQQAQALDSYRQLDDQRRARIYELEGELVKAVAERNVATEERSHALIDVSQKKLELQDAIEAGELMKAEIDKLRQELSADAVRQELEELKAKNFALLERLATVENAAATHNETLRGAMAADDKRLRDAEERVWPGETRGCDAPDAMADEILSLRRQLADAQRAASDEFAERQVLTAEQDQDAEIWKQQLDGAQAEVKYLRERLDEERSVSAGFLRKLVAAEAAASMQRLGIERLQVFVGKVRSVMDRQYDGVEFDDLSRALAELDAGTSEPEGGK